MVAAMKRRSSSQGRAAKRNRTRKLIPTVVDAIVECESVPADLRALLKHALPVVLEANKEDRHAYEAEVVAQAGNCIKTAQDCRANEHKAALATQNEMIAPAEEKKRAKAKADAEAHLEAVKAKLEGNKATKKACEKAVDEAEAALKQAKHDGDDAVRKANHDGNDAIRAAQKDQKAADKELQHLNDKKAALTNALEQDFAMLQSGTAPDNKAQNKAVHHLEAVGKEYNFDVTLLHTLPLAAKKAADSRTEFEKMMFTSFKAGMDGEINSLNQKIAAATPAQAAAVQAVEGAEAAKVNAIQNAETAKATAIAAAQQTLEAANEALKTAEEELAATQTARQEASHEVSKATTHLKHIWEDMRKVCDAQDEAAEALKHVKEEVWAAFEELKEKAPEPEPVEEPEPMEEEAAPAAAEPEAAA